MVKFSLKTKCLSFVDNFKPMRYLMRKLHIRDTDQIRSKIRTIYINNEKPVDYNEPDVPFKYKSNRIKTSKYNIFNFLPKNIFEQFRRIANFYFLINVIIIFIIPDPPVSPYTSIIPLLFVVLVTAIKQAYEGEYFLKKFYSSTVTNSFPWNYAWKYDMTYLFMDH